MSKKRVLVLKFGALGDVIRTSYLLPGLHAKFGGEASVSWVTAPEALSLLRHNPHVSELISASRCAAGALPEALTGIDFDWVLSLDDEKESCGIAQRVSAGRISGTFLRDGAVHYSRNNNI